MKKVLYRIFIFVVVFIIIVNIFSIFHASLFGFRLYRIATGSMVPYLNINDYILVKKSNDYKEGDVITYTSGETYVTHRIVSITDENIVTKGDANNTMDEPITKDNIIGKVVLKFGFLGFIIYLFSKPFIWGLLFIIGIVITAFLPDKKRKVIKK